MTSRVHHSHEAPPRTRRTHRPRAPKVPFGRTAIIAELVVALAFLGYLLSQQGVRLPLGGGPPTIKAVFDDASGLATRNHDQVTVAGVPVGQVQEVAYDNGVAVATLELSDSVIEAVRADATARIVPRSALQDLTVDIDPGDPGASPLGDGATIPPSRTSTTVGSDRLLGVLDADTRAQTQVLLGQLAVGLHGRGAALRGDLAELGRLVDSATPVTSALAERRALLARFVDRLAVVSKRLEERDAQLGDSIEVARRTLDVTAAREGELSASVRALPATLGRAGEALRAVRALAGPLEPTLDELRPFARRLPGALAALRDFVPPGRLLIADVRRLADRAASPVHHLTAALAELQPAARKLRGPVEKALPVLRAVNRNKQGIGVLGDRFSGVFSTNDANGPILRGLGFFEPLDPADLGFEGAGSRAGGVAAVRALTRVCLQDNPAACLARYLVPGLPGAVVGGGAEEADG